MRGFLIYRIEKKYLYINQKSIDMKNLKNRIKGLSFNEVFQLVLKEKIEKGIDDSERKYLEDVLIGWNIYPSIDKKAYE